MSHEIETLARHVQLLESRVHAMRQQRWLIAAGALVVLGVSAFGAAPQDLTVRSLTVVAPDGRKQLFLIGDDEGGQVNLYGKTGDRAVALGVDHGAGFSDWFGPDGERRATVFTGKTGSGQFQFLDPGKQAVAVIGGDDQGGFFNVRSHAGKIASYMEIDKNGNGIFGVYAGVDGNRRSLVGVDERGVGAVQVFDKDGKSRGRLP